MPIISIISQPPTNALKAAYRPIVFMVRASRTDGNAMPPIMYCDVYINGIFYKTQERTQYEVLNSTNSDWKFDIQDACQEVLSATIQINGGSAIIQDSLSMKQVYCKFRSSGYDVNGFITPEGTKPVQGTGTVLPVAGTGTQSSSFFAVMSTLQHDQNQDAAIHLGFYKTGTWDANVFPLSHRKAGYKVCAGDSDYFPIVNLSTKNPLCIRLFYKNRGDASFSSVSQCGEVSCTAVSVPAFTFADAIVGTPYSKTVSIGGTAPFTLPSFTTDATWLYAAITGSNLVFSGTPAEGDVGTDKSVSFTVNNDCGSQDVATSISVSSDSPPEPPPEGYFIITNTSPNAAITNVTPSVYSYNSTDQDFPVGKNSTINGTHTAFTAALAVDISTPDSCVLTLYLNGTSLQVLNPTGSSTYTFDSRAFVDTDNIEIKLT